MAHDLAFAYPSVPAQLLMAPDACQKLPETQLLMMLVGVQQACMPGQHRELTALAWPARSAADLMRLMTSCMDAATVFSAPMVLPMLPLLLSARTTREGLRTRTRNCSIEVLEIMGPT